MNHYQVAFHDIVFSGKDPEQVLQEASQKEGMTFETLEVIRKIQKPETIELAKTFGSVNIKNSNHAIAIETLDQALALFKEEKISGFEIGGYVDQNNTRWSPCGRVRKWGHLPGIAQLKQVNHLGQEGSGAYGHIDSVSMKKFLDQLVQLASISTNGPLNSYLQKISRPRFSERQPKFKAL